MSLPRYELLDAGDTPVVRAFGSTLAELFENASEAMFSIGTDRSEIPPTYSRPLVAPGDTWAELLGNWLDELLAAASVEGLVWSSCMIDRLESGGVQGSAAGLPAAQVTPTGPRVSAVRRPVADPVPIPDGYWVDVVFDLAPLLRSV